MNSKVSGPGSRTAGSLEGTTGTVGSSLGAGEAEGDGAGTRRGLPRTGEGRTGGEKPPQKDVVGDVVDTGGQ